MAAFQGRDSDQAGSQDGPSQHLQPSGRVAHTDQERTPRNERIFLNECEG